MESDLTSLKDSVISVLDELPPGSVAEVLDFALFLQGRLQEDEEQRQKRIEALFDAADRLAALDLPPLSESEIEAEIQAARAERRAAYARSR
jgi:hypothetical protein